MKNELETTMIKIFLPLMMTINAFASIGFSESKSLDLIKLRGNVSVRCQSNGYNRSYIVSCSDSFIKGGNYQYLTLDSNIEVDHFRITNIKNGIIKTGKVLNYKSKNLVNLWVRSLTQRALLVEGNNQISFELFSKNNDSIIEGVETISVNTIEQRRCSTGFLYYNNICPSNFTICSDYFYRYNNCR